MNSLFPSLWTNGRNDIDPFTAMRREMDAALERIARQWPGMEKNGWPLAGLKGGVPAVNIAESKDAIDVSAELPGLDEKDVNVRIEGNRLIISGERKQESEKTEKDWHVIESSFGSFQRIIALPFEPAGDAISASFDKGMLNVSVKKPAEQIAASRKIEIKPGKAAV